MLKAVLIQQMHQALLDTEDGEGVNTAAVVTLLDAAFRTVPPDVAETMLLEGHSGPTATAWHAHFGSHLFSAKVTVLFQELYRHRGKAREALEHVRPHLCVLCCPALPCSAFLVCVSLFSVIRNSSLFVCTCLRHELPLACTAPLKVEFYSKRHTCCFSWVLGLRDMVENSG